jgi:hypothetical protein
MKNYVLNNDNLQFEVKEPTPKNPKQKEPEPNSQLMESEEFPEKTKLEVNRSSGESLVRRTKLLSDYKNRAGTIKEVDEEEEDILEVKETKEMGHIKEQKEDEDLSKRMSQETPGENSQPQIAKVNPFLIKKPNQNVKDFELEVESEHESEATKKEEIKTVAVLGACGFLGYKICKLLLEKEYSIVMGIPEDTSREDQELIQTLTEEYSAERVQAFEFNFFDASKSETFLRGCQALVHCARVRRK